MWWWVSGIIVILFFLVMISYIQFSFHLMRKGKDDLLRYDIKALLGLVRFRVEVPVIIFKGLDKGIDYKADAILKNTDYVFGAYSEQMDKTKMFEHIGRIQKLIRHVHQFNTWMNQTLSYIKCDKLRWDTYVGIGDCPSTAVLAGSVWGLKSAVVSYVSSKIKLRAKPELAVNPQYNQSMFDMEMYYVFKIRHAHAFWANLSLLYRIIKVKGGFKTWVRFAADLYKSWRVKKSKQP